MKNEENHRRDAETPRLFFPPRLCVSAVNI